MLLASVLITTPVSVHLDTLESYVIYLLSLSVMSVHVKMVVIAPWWQQYQSVNAQRTLMAQDVKVSMHMKQASF